MSARWSVQWECGVQDLCLFQMCIFMLGKSHAKKNWFHLIRELIVKSFWGHTWNPLIYIDLFFTSTPAETIKIGHWIVLPVHKGSGGNPNSHKTEEQSIRQVFFFHGNVRVYWAMFLFQLKINELSSYWRPLVELTSPVNRQDYQLRFSTAWGWLNPTVDKSPKVRKVWFHQF